MLVVVGGFQGLEPRHLNIQIHFLLDHRIARRQRLDLGIRQRCIVQIIRTAGRAFARHNLPDELLFGFQKLPHIAVEGRFCDITILIHLGIGVALADHAPVALLNVRGLPPAVQMMCCHQQPLHIGACAHLTSAAHQHAHITAAHLGKQLGFFHLGVGAVDELHLVFGNAHRNQQIAQIIVHIKAVRFRGG